MKYLIKGVFIWIVLILFSIPSCLIKRDNTDSLLSRKSKIKESKNTFKTSSSGREDTITFIAMLIDANKEKFLGKPKDALEYYDKCLKMEPSNSVVYYEISKLLVAMSDLPGALNNIKKAIFFENDNIWYQLLQIDIYLQSKMNKEAIEVYETLIIKYPNHIELFFNLATLYSSVYQFDKAINIYDKIEKKTGINENIVIPKTQIYLKTHRTDLIYNELTKLINAFPFEYRYKGMLAEYYTANNQPDKAIEIYNNLVKFDPNNGMIRISFANHFLLFNQFENALEQLKIGFKDPNIEIPNKINLLLNYFPYSDSNKKPMAFELLKCLLETHPDDATLLTVYADYLIRDKKLNEAKIQLEKVIDLDKTSYKVWEQLLKIYIELNDFTTLLQKSNDALLLFPNSPNIYLFNGLANYYLHNDNEALNSLQMGLNLVINDNVLKSEFYTYLGEVYNRLKMYTKSDESFDKSLKFLPDNPSVLNNYSYFLALRSVNLDKAEEMINKCLSSDPVNYTYLDTYSWILFKLNKIELSEKVILQAIDLGGKTNAVIIEHYGDILFKKGEKDKAIVQWKLAKTIGLGTDKLNEKIEKGFLIE